jgi:hypothetical protein
MSLSRPIQWYHSHVDAIWLDGTFNQQGPMVVRKNIPPWHTTNCLSGYVASADSSSSGTSHPVYYLIVLLSMEYITPPSQSELMMLLSTTSPSW